MTTKSSILLDRIQRADGFVPRVGDVFRSVRTPKDLFVVVGEARPTTAYPFTHIAVLRRARGNWVESHCERHVFAHGGDFRLVDVGYDKLIWGGFSPNDTGRQYTLHKQAAGVILRAGCRAFTTYAQAARHWRVNGHSEMPVEKREIAKRLFAEARRRGWLKVGRARPVKKAVRR